MIRLKKYGYNTDMIKYPGCNLWSRKNFAYVIPPGKIVCVLPISRGYFESQSAIVRRQSIHFATRRLSCIVFVGAIELATMLLRARIFLDPHRCITADSTSSSRQFHWFIRLTKKHLVSETFSSSAMYHKLLFQELMKQRTERKNKESCCPSQDSFEISFYRRKNNKEIRKYAWVIFQIKIFEYE